MQVSITKFIFFFFFFHLKFVINPGQRDITAFYRDEEAAISRQNNDNP